MVATGTKSRNTRKLVVGPRSSEEFAVEVPTHLAVPTSFESGGQAPVPVESAAETRTDKP